MEEAALNRKQKLTALRAKKTLLSDQQSEEEEHTSGHRKRPAEESGADHAPSTLQNTVEKEAETIESDLRARVEALPSTEVDLFTLAPRKVDWDLKRDLEPKLQMLERRTQVKIAELIRSRLDNEVKSV